MQTVLTDENGFWNNKNASIHTLVVSHNDNVSLSYFAEVKYAGITCRQYRCFNASKTRLPFALI